MTINTSEQLHSLLYTPSCEVEEMPHANNSHTNERITGFPVANTPPKQLNTVHNL